MNILGLTSASGGFHDGSVAWIKDGVVQFAQSEERITRIKHDYSFPSKTLAEILNVSGLKPDDFEGVAVAWKPYNAFSGFFKRKLLDVPKTVGHCFLTKPMATFDYSMNNFLNFKIRGTRSLLSDYDFKHGKIHYYSHHLSHAASSYRTSGFEKALSVNLDCFGPDDIGNLWGGASYICENNKITLLEYIPPYASVGLFYSAVSVCLGFKFGDGEGKTMGLAAYGEPESAYEQLRLVAPLFRDGRWVGPASWSDFRLIDRPELLFSTRWGRYLRTLIKNTSREAVAAAAQKILEEELTNYFDYLIKKTGVQKIALAGGIFLNVSFNRILSERDDVESVHIHPFPSDGGDCRRGRVGTICRPYRNRSQHSAHLGSIGFGVFRY